ncbi:uncharacterized protein si:ch211-217g15.3 [Coregonus clupeaformis]|uniref:uncharacterized protein si:ch211-217g15.3 n=1 Tax=Coregonus clupeaformis TaxID=59861 RepID=UPI001E1C3B2D|nr:uncharacterized protein si:ch211-217g15.3 [Coregonus clupeaformis]
MFRISALICISLLVYGNSAKPYKSWGKVAESAVQETLMSEEEKGMFDLGLKQVEAPENMDITDNDINPVMPIWKNMRGDRGGGKRQKVEKEVEIEVVKGRYSTTEEDMDHLYHPSMEQPQEADLARARPQTEDTFVGVAIQTEPIEEDNTKYYQEAGIDLDNISHLFSGLVDPRHPEQDWDELYHPEMKGGDWPQVDVPHQGELSAVGAEVRGHSKPEEDRDDLYHGDLPVPVQVIGRGQDMQQSADWPSQRMYSQPEEDLDDLYHH